MSGLPTLLKPGAVLYQPWMTTAQKNKLSTQKSIDFLIDYLLERSWNKQEPPKIPIKGPGSRVLVLRSGTGTGKSTVVPAHIYTKFFEELVIKKNIICTQPTVVTASDIPYQIIQNYKNLHMDVNIGFQTGSLVRKPVKGVLFATVGILLQHLKLLTDEEFMKKYSFIILDEIHNRSIEVDTTLFYLKNLLDRNYEHPDCPYIILTSGTFEPEVFMNYFKCPKDAFLDVVGSSHPIVDNFTTFDVTDYISYAVDLIEKIHLENIPDITAGKEYRDIMLFLQGGAQIKKVTDEIHKLNASVFVKGLEYSVSHMKTQQKKYTGGKTAPETYYLCPIMLMSENIQKGEKDYQDLFSDISSVLVAIYEFDDDGKRTDNVIDTVHASRKVIISTNSAETGITIPGLKYCIDSGMVNESQFNPNFGCDILMNKNITQASSRQRRGRVGRKEPGVFYTCYTKETYDLMPTIPFPDIVKADATGFVLDVILSDTETKLEEIDKENISKDIDECFQMNQFDQRWYRLTYTKPFNVKKLNFIQYPAADSLSYAVEKLHGLGFIDHEYKPTLFGYFGSKFRKVDIENVRMILAGYQHGACILDLITITCFLQAGHKLGIKKNKYIPRNILDLSDEESMVYFTKVIADEFIEYIFIWDDYMSAIADLNKLVGKYADKVDGSGVKTKEKKQQSKTVSKTDPHYIRNYLRKWAEQNYFSYDVLLKITAARDEMIADLLNIGLNPYHNSLNLPRGTYNLKKIIRNNLDEGLAEVQKIKKSIYEGYRFDVYTWNTERNSYVSEYGNNSVILDSKITKSKDPNERPKNIVLASCMLQPSSTNPGMYDFTGGDVSVLDDYVDVDYGFINT